MNSKFYSDGLSDGGETNSLFCPPQTGSLQDLADQDCDARECALFAGEFDENYLFLGD